jgi:hypothetical protein
LIVEKLLADDKSGPTPVHGKEAKDYDIRIENRNSGAGVHISGDQTLEKLLFWPIRTVESAEPYIRLKIEPGVESRWKISYEFYAMAPTPAQ